MPPIINRSAQDRRVLAIYKPAIGDSVAPAIRHIAIGLRRAIGGDRQFLRIHRQQTSAVESESVAVGGTESALRNDDGVVSYIGGRGRTHREKAGGAANAGGVP